MEKTLLCTPGNVREFNAAMRQELPGAHELARALVEAGLMDGLRGACIAPVGALEAGVVRNLSPAAEKRLLDAAAAPQYPAGQGRG